MPHTSLIWFYLVHLCHGNNRDNCSQKKAVNSKFHTQPANYFSMARDRTLTINSMNCPCENVLLSNAMMKKNVTNFNLRVLFASSCSVL